MTEYHDQETTVDLREIIRILKKRYKLILLIFSISVIVASVVSLLIPNTYEAEAKLRIKQPKGLANSLLAELPTGNGMATQQLIATYAEIVKSRAVVEELIKKVPDPKEPQVKYEEMVNRIAIAPVKNTEIMQVKVQARRAPQAMRLTNNLIQVFIERLTTLARSEQTMVKGFIGDRLREAKRELTVTENQLENYKKAQKIVAPQEETKALIDRLTEVNRLTASNQVEVATTQAKLDGIKAQLEQEKIEYVATNPLIEQARAKLADLEVRLVGIAQKYTANHPEVIAVNAEIEQTKTRLEAEIKRVVNAEAPSQNPVHQELLQQRIQAEVEIGAATAQQVALKKLLAHGEREIIKLPSQEQELARLMRDTSVAQEIYVMLAKRYEEARISEVMQPNDVQIIDQAIIPEHPIKPKRKLNVLIAGFLGLFIGIGLAFLLEYLNKTVSTPEDVTKYLDLPTLGSIPDYDSFQKNMKQQH